MEDLLKRVSALNNEIAKLEKERLVAKTQKDTIEKSLLERISKYKEKYGIDLSGNSVSDVEEAITKELKTVSDKCEKELALKEKVVDAIKSGEVEKARKLLGIKEEKPSQPAEPESRVNTTPVGEVEEESEEGSTEKTTKELSTDDFEDDFDASEVDFTGDEEEDSVDDEVSFEEDPLKVVEEDDTDLGDFSFEGDDYNEDDDEEEEFLFSNSATAVSKGSAEYKQRLSSVEKSVEDVEKEDQANKEAAKSTPKKPSGSFLFDDDDDGESLGFKSLLNGSKFEY